MSFSKLPPEINSTQIYSGPGPDSMYAADEGWKKLADEMSLVPEQIQKMLTELHANYLGESAEGLTAHVEGYSSSYSYAAMHMTQNALLAYDFADAFAAARRNVVDPELIAQNRANLGALIATNTFGGNTQLIDEVENEYQEFWAQDAAAMETYAGKAQEVLSRLEALPIVPPAMVDEVVNSNIRNKYVSIQELREASLNDDIGNILRHLKESGCVDLADLLERQGHL